MLESGACNPEMDERISPVTFGLRPDEGDEDEDEDEEEEEEEEELMLAQVREISLRECDQGRDGSAWDANEIRVAVELPWEDEELLLHEIKRESLKSYIETLQSSKPGAENYFGWQWAKRRRDGEV